MKILFLIICILLSGCGVREKEQPDKRPVTTEKSKKVNYYEEENKESVVGEAVTEIIDRGENRVSNITLACSQISGKKLSPGEEFSFNNITGKKDKSSGYKDAPVLADGETSQGIGGGVCQVSTTLYMAVLNGGLNVTEHYNHSEDVPYAPQGMDATVVYGVKDFKFINSTSADIFIYTWVENNRVYAKLVQMN